MTQKPLLSDLDLQLYLARVLPLYKRLLMTVALSVNSDLRKRLSQVLADNAAFQTQEMPGLQKKLFPKAPRVFVFTPSPSHLPRWNSAWAGALSLLVLCAVPFLFKSPKSANDEFTAKGRGLGINLFVKGDTSYRVDHQAARIAPTDTLQVVPLGSEPQQLILLGWDERQGLTRLFPKSGAYSQRVSPLEPPPALLLQGLAENRLICVTATAPFRVEDILALLAKKPYEPLGQVPSSRLENGKYVQIFAISKKGGRI